MTPSGHNWVQGQGAGPRLAKDDGEEEEKVSTPTHYIL
jgi:elongation factor 3